MRREFGLMLGGGVVFLVALILRATGALDGLGTSDVGGLLRLVVLWGLTFAGLGGVLWGAMLYAGDRVFQGITASVATLIIVILVIVALALTAGSVDSFKEFGFGFITGSEWDSGKEQYGALPLIFGTLVTSAIALVIAVPISLGIAIFLAELAPQWLRTPLSFIVELLAAVPSVIYGLWGIFILRPFLLENIEPGVSKSFGFLPFFERGGGGSNILLASLVLAIMILPTISSVTREVLRAVPNVLREGALALGATRWEAVRTVVLPFARSGIVGAIILGLGRALGETMAIAMLIGNKEQTQWSVFKPAATMASEIANKYPEASGLQQASLTEVGLLLFLVTLTLNVFARILVWRTSQQKASRPNPAFSIVRYVLFGLATLFVVFGLIRNQGWFEGARPVLIVAAAAIALTIVAIGWARGLETVRVALSPRGKYLLRKVIDWTVRYATVLATFLAIVPLGLILAYLVVKGVPGIGAPKELSLFPPKVDWPFFTDLPAPPGEGGGMANAIVGTVVLVAMACAIGVPLGVLAAVFVTEFGRNKFGRAIRFAADVMSGTPSIVAGLLVYALVVRNFKNSALAGAIALAILMLPTIMRTSEELLVLVPDALREAGLALGVPKWRVVLRVVLRTAAPGIATGIVLAVARVSGETAPLLFTASGSNLWWFDSADQWWKVWDWNLTNQPFPSLTLQIYQLSGSAYEDQQAQAWGGALVLVTIVLLLNIAARFLVRHRVQGART